MRSRRLCLGAATWALLSTTACVGELTSDGGSPDGVLVAPADPGMAAPGSASDPFAGGPISAPVECDAAGLPGSGFRRLNARELGNVVTDLLKVQLDPAKLPTDGLTVRGYDTDASSLKLLELDADKYYAAIVAAVEQAFVAGTQPFASCASGPQRASCLDERLGAFLKQAFRRSPPAAVLQQIQALRAAETDETEGLKAALVAGLLSARTLFLNSSNATVSPGQAYRLDEYQIAERLAFFLWSSPPDTQLLQLAEQGKLGNVEALREVALRMMADDRFNGFMQGFVTSWLGLRNTVDVRKDAQQYPGFSQPLLADMVQETQLFMADVLHGAVPLSDVLLGRQTYINGRLAALYEIPGVTGDAFQKVMLPVDTRLGLLTQGSVLAITGGQVHPSPVERGVWLTRKLSCTELPPPPPNVPLLDVTKQPGLSPRQALERHRTNAACAACHDHIDPYGLALEKYDSVGQFRQTYDDGTPIDARASIDGKSFDGPAELGALLAKDTLPGCMADHLSTYALGNVPAKVDNCFARAFVGRFQKGSGNFQELITELVTSELFFRAVSQGDAP